MTFEVAFHICEQGDSPISDNLSSSRITPPTIIKRDNFKRPELPERYNRINSQDTSDDTTPGVTPIAEPYTSACGQSVIERALNKKREAEL